MNSVTLNNNQAMDLESLHSRSINETNIAVQTHKSSTDILVNHRNNVALTNNESRTKSNSINKTNITVQARKSPTKPNIDILVNHSNDVTNNNLRKKPSPIDVPSSNNGNTSVSNYSTVLYEGPSTSSGYYSTANNLPPIHFRTIYSSDDNTDSN